MDDGDRTVGIIGAGAVGQAIAGHLARNGIHGVLCDSGDPGTLEALVERLGPTMRAGTLEAAVTPEIVILTVPWEMVDEVLSSVPDWEGRILVDATNPSLAGAKTSGEVGNSSARVAAMAHGARLVKALNTLPAALLAKQPQEDAGRRVLFISGDHDRAKRQIVRIVEEIGFSAVDLGTLAVGGPLQQLPGGAVAMLNLLRV